MGEQGFNIQGVWINKNTGEKIIVRDSFIGENGMNIITADGYNIDVNEFSKNYMQASEEVYDSDGKQIGVEKITDDDLGIEKTYKNDLFSVFESKDKKKKENYIEEKILDHGHSEPKPGKKSLNNNYNIIKKFFDKFDTHIDIDLNLNWTDIPKEGLKTLIDYLDVKEEEISEYIYDNYLNKDKIKEILKNKVSDLLKN